MRRAIRVLLALALASALAAIDAKGQEPMEMPVDSGPLPGDTVRFPLQGNFGLRACDPPAQRVVRDAADVAWFRRWRECADVDFGDLARRSLVTLWLSGDCRAAIWVEAWRSESRRAIILRTRYRDGGCRAARGEHVWYEIPPLAPGWTVILSPEPRARYPWET
jgi:hypothetical protein